MFTAKVIVDGPFKIDTVPSSMHVEAVPGNRRLLIMGVIVVVVIAFILVRVARSKP